MKNPVNKDDSASKRLHNRRKTLGILSGGVVATIWHKPMIESVVLPAHAQTSGGEVTTTATVAGVAIPDQTSINIDFPIAHPNGTPPTVSRVVLELDIEHPFQGDITVTLTNPVGTSSTLVDRVGTGNSPFGCTGDNFMIVLDDSASAGLPVNLASCPAGSLTGTFNTGGGLTAFNGEQANGDWVLAITDAAMNDSGTLTRAQLSITCA